MLLFCSLCKFDPIGAYVYEFAVETTCMQFSFTLTLIFSECLDTKFASEASVANVFCNCVHIGTVSAACGIKVQVVAVQLVRWLVLYNF
jgi:hypothetical protein